MSDKALETAADLGDAIDSGRQLNLMERRRFLQAALVAGGGAVALPTMFADVLSAQASSTNTILLTVTLGGGNDGLNTLGPFANGFYRDLRGPLAVPVSGSYSADDGMYFHPRMRRLATRFRRGDVAAVRGVGDPLLDQSHFSNLARWQSANPNGSISGTGWLGRWLDAHGAGQFGGIAIGGQGVPLHMRGTSADVTDLPRGGGALYGSDRSQERDLRMYRAIRQMGVNSDRPAWVNRVGEVNSQAIDAAQAVAPSFNQELPEARLTRDMVLAARVINLNLGTRVVNIWHNGYDTHDRQIGGDATTGDHADLLDELDIGLDAFFASLSAPMAERVVALVYTEFGRRAEANGSLGTDHGTANHVFLVGRRVKGGLYGSQPPLRNLDDRGNLRVSTDFRDVYATVVEQALGTDSQQVLGARYSSIPSLVSATSLGDGGSLADRAEAIRRRREADPKDYLLDRATTF